MRPVGGYSSSLLGKEGIRAQTDCVLTLAGESDSDNENQRGGQLELGPGHTFRSGQQIHNGSCQFLKVWTLN